MKREICLVTTLFTLIFATSAHAQNDDKAVMLTGMSLPAFVKAFNGHAKFDQEPLIELKSCRQAPIPNSKLRTFTCVTGFEAFVHGTVYENDTVKHVSIDAKPIDADGSHRFRRASGYLVRAVKGGSIFGVGTLVADLLSMVAKSGGKLQQSKNYGLQFSAARDPDLGWTFGAERAEQ